MAGYEIEDPRSIARDAPYTFFLPTEAEVRGLAVGDLVKLMFRSIPPSDKWDAERMWVVIDEIGEDGAFIGKLESSPSDMPGLEKGAKITFEAHHILSTLFVDEGRRPTPAIREYWDRCLVDDCVLYEGLSIQFLYRELPDMKKSEDEFPDSGWRIRGDYRGLGDDEIDARKMSYVALGAVLNRDDSWLHLIDEPVGSAFIRNFNTGEYEREVMPAQDGST